MLRVDGHDDLRVDGADHLADLAFAEVARGVQLVSLQAESIEPVLEHRIVDIVLLERLALRMDERRTRRWPQVDELRQMPKIELHQVGRRASGDLFRRDDA